MGEMDGWKREGERERQQHALATTNSINTTRVAANAEQWRH